MVSYLKKQGASFCILWGACALFFIVCIVFPLFCTLLSPRLSDFVRVFSTGRYRTVIVNTAAECICSTVFSVLLGYLYAYAVVRGEIPFVRFFSVVPVIHMVTPPFVGGLSFILLLGRQGFITKTLLGLDVSLYGLPGIVISQVLCFFPLAYLMCAQTLRGINPLYERAARGMGAGRLKVFISVTLPLSFPGILSSFLFIAVSVLSDFGNPMIVGGRFKVLAVEIYTQLTGWMNVSVSVVLGIILVVPSIILFILQHKILKDTSVRSATVGGKEAAVSAERLCLSVRIFLTLFCAFLSGAVLLQFAAVLTGSFQKLWGIDTRFTAEHILSVHRYCAELLDSVLFALCSAVLTTALASVTAFFVQKTDSPFRKTFDTFAQIPSAIPGSLLGLALSFAANKTGFSFSPALIVAAMIVSFLPFSYRIITSSYLQQKNTLVYGAQSLGAGKITVFRSVSVPLAGSALFSSFVYVFVRSIGTMSAVIFLVSFKTKLASIAILNLAEQGDWGKAAALASVLTCIAFLVLGIGRFALRRFSR